MTKVLVMGGGSSSEALQWAVAFALSGTVYQVVSEDNAGQIQLAKIARTVRIDAVECCAVNAFVDEKRAQPWYRRGRTGKPLKF